MGAAASAARAGGAGGARKVRARRPYAPKPKAPSAFVAPVSCAYKNGDVYEGECRPGGLLARASKAEGKGRYLYACGDVFDGQYKSDKMEGTGMYAHATGDSYSGEWRGDKMDGHGICAFANGDVYIGQFRGDKLDGRGKYIFRAVSAEQGGGLAAVYDGQWKDDKLNGRGTYYYADGEADVSMYQAGREVGEGARWSADRQQAWRLRAGKADKEISLDDAKRIADRVGELVPAAGEEVQPFVEDPDAEYSTEE